MTGTVETLARRLMDEHDLTDWTFTVSSRLHYCYGQCDQIDKVITVSQHHIDEQTLDEVRDTILHEIAHALVGRFVKPHGKEWKAMAVRLGANPRSCSTVKATGDVWKGKWETTCTLCGKVEREHNRRRIKCGCEGEGIPWRDRKAVLMWRNTKTGETWDGVRPGPKFRWAWKCSKCGGLVHFNPTDMHRYTHCGPRKVKWARVKVPTLAAPVALSSTRTCAVASGLIRYRGDKNGQGPAVAPSGGQRRPRGDHASTPVNVAVTKGGRRAPSSGTTRRGRTMATPKTIIGTRALEQLTFLTTAQAAELLQVSEEHVRRLVRRGDLPGAERRFGVTRIRTAALLGASS